MSDCGVTHPPAHFAHQPQYQYCRDQFLCFWGQGLAVAISIVAIATGATVTAIATGATVTAVTTRASTIITSFTAIITVITTPTTFSILPFFAIPSVTKPTPYPISSLAFNIWAY